ncbi:hypothetical protein E3O25_14225 [Cryobacterium sp. TMT1-3]|uniref:Uncharacterized protein n=1 Tax=Cryobacterium luteum TaxID=1424661 RepID=A0A1H8JJU5_9MICO|nr:MULTISPECIES: hypothetical protein [Cryobacterium]TFB83933.1 hypothetical protein E3O10_16785 [Cryobacterium luteum]TFC25153.1 hypothetical protein E3O25_14225 [Cryobacterium sp. TMT1-3]SEN80821.1 hypothetical protein SAMN05216281_1159 [Cryobacterium luteum]
MTASDTVSGYRITVPAGWQRVTTGDGSAESIERFIAWKLRKQSGRDHVLTERALREQMPRLVSDAEAAGALDLYVFSEEIRGVPVVMSFVVSMTYLGASAADLDEADLAEVAGFGATESEFVDLEVGRCFRAVEHRASTVAEFRRLVAGQFAGSAQLDLPKADTAQAFEAVALIRNEESSGRMLPSTRVSYLLPVPASPGAFLLVVFSCDDSSFSEVQVLMFDAIVTTLKWV